jgi:carboxylesterase type B
MADDSRQQPAAPIHRRRLLAGGAAMAAGATVMGPLASDASATGPGSSRQISRHSHRPRPLNAAQIATGRIRGVEAATPDVSVFKGIPYGATTAGDNRWRAPEPAAPWSGVRICDTWGDACPQYTASLPTWADPPNFSEDCLNLNVWTGASDSHERRPVMVWLYGGAGAAMWDSQPIWDGSVLADKGMVVVTINYRFNALGHLSTTELSEEFGHGSGNWGHLDALAALRWVRRNIHAFGGDPDRVTLGGWSHGSSLSWVLLFSKLARGLLHRCLLESGVQYTKDPVLNQVAGKYRSQADAETTGARFSAYVGASSLADLRAMDATELQVASKIGPPEARGFGTVLDGYVLPDSYSEIFRTRTFNDVPVMTGNNKDENGATPNQSITLEKFKSTAATVYGSLADEFLAAYPARSDAEASRRTNDADRDNERTSTYLWGKQWLASGASSSVYNYYWTRVPPGVEKTSPIIDPSAAGAFHGAEMFYLFGNLAGTDRPWGREDYVIADKLTSYVVNFAATGDPNGGKPGQHGHSRDSCVRRGLPRWPELRGRTPAVMELGEEFGPVSVADTDPRLEFQEAYLTSREIEY